MKSIAPNLEWLPNGGWIGAAPKWPFARAEPEDIDDFLHGRTLTVRVKYSEAFPMIPPSIWPLDPEPDPRYRTQTAWHVNPNGSLCLLQSASDWTGNETGAELVQKASAWFIEYLLMEDGLIEEMTINGIVNDDGLDHLLRAPAKE